MREVNNAPVLAPILSRNINEGSTLTVTNSATDPDNPPQLLTFSLGANAPAGMTIDPASGLISWTPTEAQGPGNYSITVRVTDNGTPLQSDAKTFSVSVSEVNSQPQLSFPSNWTVRAEALLAFTAMATDPDLPAQMLTFSLEGASGAGVPPAGAHIDPATGLFTWTPASTDVGTNLMILRVTDNGSPPASAAGALRVAVLSAFRTTISLSANLSTISFNTIAGRTYRVEYKDNLSDATWTRLGSDTKANSDTLTFQDALDSRLQRFYRVVEVE